ncbi:hypothetical protein JB92DRAFT_3084600 [Gautieria morchelliformis]|nr:hypothetical protein JB92DRAFT_3084600 [Gautieria morchelliformis]
MYVLAIGASRNIGYLSCLRLLGEGHAVTFLLRKPAVFDKDSKMQKHIKEGRAKVISGDATIRADVQKALTDARIDGRLDAVLFTVGGTPSFSPLKGFVIKPPNLCSSCLYNVLVSYPEATPTSPQPKLIVISSNGLTKASHDTLPLLLKPIFTYGLHGPHVDKLTMERAAFHAAKWTWPQEDPNELTEFLGPNWQKEMKAPGYLTELVIIRPSLLVDGDDKPAKGDYKTTVEEFKGVYSISRKEVAHFVVEGVLKNWEQWRGSVVKITQ